MSRLKDLMVEIGFDVSDVEKGIGKLSKQFDNLGKEFVKKTVKSMPKDPFNIGAERTRTQKFIKELKDLGQEVGSYQKKLKTLKTPEQFKEFRGELKQYKKDYFEFQDAVSEKQLKTFKDNLQREEDLKKKLIEKEKAKQKAIQKTKDDERKAFAEKQKMLSDARIKQATGNLTSVSGKSAKDSASVFSNNFGASDKELKAIREKNRLRNEVYGKERQARLKSSQDAQKALQKRLKDFKKSKQKELDQHKSTNKEKLSDTERYLKRARRLEEQLRFSANFRRLPDTEKNRFEGQIKSARKLMITQGNDYGFRKLSSDVREFRRSLIGLHTVQMGLTDSARNMLRAYASVFALVESTAAIERIGMDFQGMEVAMLASAGTAQKAAKDLEFVKGLANEMGLNLKDSADAYVKLQMASRGKMDDSQIKELFQGLTEFGTALKVAPESMKLAQRALSQMASKGQIMAEELDFGSVHRNMFTNKFF